MCPWIEDKPVLILGVLSCAIKGEGIVNILRLYSHRLIHVTSGTCHANASMEDTRNGEQMGSLRDSFMKLQ